MALFEYGCPSLEYVYDMTWAEFKMREFAYDRKQEKDWFKIRELAYASIIGPHLDPKKVPSKERFMPLGKKPGISEKMRERMKEAIKEYKDKKNAKS